MKQALVTMALSDEYKRIGNDFTFPIMEDYCKRYGLDFVYIDHLKKSRSFSWERLVWMYDILSEYDRVIHAEVDVIIAKDARNILSLLPPGTFYGIDEAAPDLDVNVYCEKALRLAEEAHGEKRTRSETVMYNSGVFVCDSMHRDVFRPAQNEMAGDMQEMGLMNVRVAGLPHKDVSPDFINLSNEWENGHRPGKPDFLHIAWQKGSKYDEVKRFMGKMGW